MRRGGGGGARPAPPPPHPRPRALPPPPPRGGREHFDRGGEPGVKGLSLAPRWVVPPPHRPAPHLADRTNGLVPSSPGTGGGQTARSGQEGAHRHPAAHEANRLRRE